MEGPFSQSITGAPDKGSTTPEPTTRPFRIALTIGFGGMLLIFLIAGIDAVRLLREMRAQNRILREASLQRSQNLATIRSYVLLSHNYMGDYLLDEDEQRSQEDLDQMRGAWSRILGALADYQKAAPDEGDLINQLQAMLDRQWQTMSPMMNWSFDERRRRGESLYGDGIRPMRTAVVEITSQVEDVDAKQMAATEERIRQVFESLGSDLNIVLDIALGAALILALGCLLYIMKIERENHQRYKEIVNGREALEQLSARLVSAQEEERRSISRELHDEVGQTLSAVLVDTANLANRIPPEDTVSRRYIDSIRTLADSSVNSIRNIALLLRPSMLDDLGLVPALEWQAREVSRRSNVRVTVNAENVPDDLPDDLRTCIYRVAQEALHNVAQHSGATTAVVSLRQTNGAQEASVASRLPLAYARGSEASILSRDREGAVVKSHTEDHTRSLELTIEDNGSGFDPRSTRGVGLLGMEERVKRIGGHMEIQANPGKGTVVRAILPLAVPVTAHS